MKKSEDARIKHNKSRSCQFSYYVLDAKSALCNAGAGA